MSGTYRFKNMVKEFIFCVIRYKIIYKSNKFFYNVFKFVYFENILP